MSNNPLLDQCDQCPHCLKLRRQHDQAGVSLGRQALIRGARNDRQRGSAFKKFSFNASSRVAEFATEGFVTVRSLTQLRRSVAVAKSLPDTDRPEPREPLARTRCEFAAQFACASI